MCGDQFVVEFQGCLYGSPRVHSSSFCEQHLKFPVEKSPLPHGEVDQRLDVL